MEADGYMQTREPKQTRWVANATAETWQSEFSSPCLGHQVSPLGRAVGTGDAEITGVLLP